MHNPGVPLRANADKLQVGGNKQLLIPDAASEDKRNLVVLTAVESDLHCCGSTQVTSTKQLHSGRRAGQHTHIRQSASYGQT